MTGSLSGLGASWGRAAPSTRPWSSKLRWHGGERLMKRLLMFSMLSIVASPARAQDSPLAWAARLEIEYRIVPNVTYLTSSNYESKLDLYVTRTVDKPLPTLIWIHGGGWTGGATET